MTTEISSYVSSGCTKQKKAVVTCWLLINHMTANLHNLKLNATLCPSRELAIGQIEIYLSSKHAFFLYLSPSAAKQSYELMIIHN